MEHTLLALSNELADATDRAGRSVVAVHARPRYSSSGVLWRPGIVVTADHAVRREEEIRVTLPDGRTVAAELAGRDPGTDLAVLKVDAAVSHTAETAAGDSLKTGNVVLAIGRSEVTGVNAAMGIISSVAGPWRTWRGSKIEQFVRLDVSLYPGGSGGAVIDIGGKVIGIATAGLSRTSILAIPAATVNRVTGQLLATGHVPRGFLGVGLQPIVLPEHLRSSPSAGGGLMVLSVEPDGPAGKGGVLLGDVLVALDGKVVEDTDGVQEFLSGDYVGKTVKASLVRGGVPAEVSITIGERPRRKA